MIIGQFSLKLTFVCAVNDKVYPTIATSTTDVDANLRYGRCINDGSHRFILQSDGFIHR